MIESYLAGSLRQSRERVRLLRGIVQRHGYAREYDGLRQICLTLLDQADNALATLATERIVDSALQTPIRIRAFKRAIELLNNIEGIGVFALMRKSPDDDFLNRLITDICHEIAYPLIPPAISQMSQDYFHVYPDFNLLCLPLIESRFLLHLPDIYHELCHPLHRNRNLDLPEVEPYKKAYKRSLFAMVAHFQGAMTAADRLRHQEARLYQMQLWQTCWTKYWMEEFFCDLFGVLTAGPAFAWSHYHLCVKRGDDPFHTPEMFETTHPADDARMRALLLALRSSNSFLGEAKKIETAWHELVTTMGYRASPEYLNCYPDDVIATLVACAKEGAIGMGITLAEAHAPSPVRDMLNEAWSVFWTAPTEYQTWEATRLGDLRTTIAA